MPRATISSPNIGKIKKNGTESSIIPADLTIARAVNNSGDIAMFAILRLSASSLRLNSLSFINFDTNSEISLYVFLNPAVAGRFRAAIALIAFVVRFDGTLSNMRAKQ